MKLKLVKKQEEVPGITTFIFSPQEKLEWKAGQYLRYKLEDPEPDKRGNNRFFTIASSPLENQVQLSTRIDVEKGSSFKKHLKDLNEGDEIEAVGPLGAFTLEDPSKQYVFIAGGIGITPFRAILIDLDKKNQPINVTLLYANRDENLPFKNLFEEIAASHPEMKIQYVTPPEKIDVEEIKKAVDDFKRPLFYVSGPQPMVEAIEKTLVELGAPFGNVKHDYFPGYSVI